MESRYSSHLQRSQSKSNRHGSSQAKNGFHAFSSTLGPGTSSQNKNGPGRPTRSRCVIQSDSDSDEIETVTDREAAAPKRSLNKHDSANSAFTHKSGKYAKMGRISKLSKQGTGGTTGPGKDNSQGRADASSSEESSQKTASQQLSDEEDELLMTSCTTNRRNRRGPLEDTDSNIESTEEPPDSTAKARLTRPKPRPVRRKPSTRRERTSTPEMDMVPSSSRCSALSSSTTFDGPTTKTKKKQTVEQPILVSDNDSSSISVAKPPAVFPMSASSFSTTEEVGPSPFPMDIVASGSSTDSRREVAAFPMLNTEDPPKKASKGKKKATKPTPAAFPMAELSPPTSAFSTPGSKSGHKRSSDYVDSDEETPVKKPKGVHRRKNPASVRTEDPKGDIADLCPFCDAPLPLHPTATLKRLLKYTSAKARSDPRPGNPSGLKAPLTAYVVFCQRHHFESTILPEAESKNWPKSIDWDQLCDRVIRMEADLRKVLDTGPDHPSSSLFWKEIVSDIRNKGSLVVEGLGEQFANFKKTQPGYYGEQGSMVIHQALYNIFPLASFDTSRIAPLNPNYFVEKVLVPEVALRLILEDQNMELNDLNAQLALATLRESTSYGTAMFPVDGTDWDVRTQSPSESQPSRKGKLNSVQATRAEDMTTAGEKMVAARAQLRRQELSVENLEGNIEIVPPSEARPKPKPKKRQKGRTTDGEKTDASNWSMSDADPEPVKSRPRRKKNLIESQSEDGEDVECLEPVTKPLRLKPALRAKDRLGLHPSVESSSSNLIHGKETSKPSAAQRKTAAPFPLSSSMVVDSDESSSRKGPYDGRGRGQENKKSKPDPKFSSKPPQLAWTTTMRVSDDSDGEPQDPDETIRIGDVALPPPPGTTNFRDRQRQAEGGFSWLLDP